jgi:hypothetical protein
MALVGVLDTLRDGLSRATAWERWVILPAGVLLLLYGFAFIAVILGGAAAIVFYEVPFYLSEHLTLEAIGTGFGDALKSLATALVIVVGWFGGCWVAKRFSSRGWVIGLVSVVFAVLLHLPVWLISGQSDKPAGVPGMPESSDLRSPVQRGIEEFGASVFRSFVLAFLVYVAFTGGAYSAKEGLVHTEFNVFRVVWFCVKVCAVVAGIAMVFAFLLGSASYDWDQGGYTDLGYEVTSDERFLHGVSVFLFFVIPTLLGVWRTLGARGRRA